MTMQPLEQLRTDLTKAIDAQRPRSRTVRARALAAMAAVVLTAGVSLFAWPPGGGSAALAITETPQWVELRISDADAGVEKMNRELREAGLDVEVTFVPVPDQLVGKWAGAETRPVSSGDDAAGSHAGDRRRDRADVADLNQVRILSAELVRLPADFEGHVLLYAGRRARPGESPSCGLPVGCAADARAVPSAVPER